METSLYQVVVALLICGAFAGAACFRTAFSRIGELRTRLEWVESKAAREFYAAARPQPGTVSPAAATCSMQFEPQQPAETEPAPVENERPVRDAHRAGKVINWELFAGGRLLNLIGGLVLVIGVGLALKYAFDQNWISQTLRVAAGLAGGVALLVFSEMVRVKEGKRWFVQGITGAGLGLLYVSGYAAFGSYHLWPFALAYGFMSCVTIGAFLIALRQDSLAVAIIGWAAGFATPLLMNEASEIGLGSYIILLDLGLVAATLAKKRWFALAPLALAASSSVAWVWYAAHAYDAHPFVCALALVSLWTVFFVADVARALQAESAEFDGKALLGLANTFVSCAYLSVVLAGHKSAFECVATCMAIAYVLAYAALTRRSVVSASQRLQWYLSAVAMVALATARQFAGVELAAVFGVEAAALGGLEFLVSRSLRRGRAPEISFGVCALMLAAGTAFILDPQALVHTGRAWQVLFGSRDFALCALIVAAFGVDRLLRRTQAWPEPVGVAVRQSAVLGVLLLTAVHAEGYWLAAVYGLLGLIAIVAGARGMLQDFEISGLALFALALGVALTQTATWVEPHILAFVPIDNTRFASFEVIALTLLAAGEVLRQRSLLPGIVARLVRGAGMLTAIAGATLEVRDTFERALAAVRLEPQTTAAIERLTQLAGGEQLAISAVWILASLVLISIGVRFRIRDLRVLAIGLFDLTILKTFFVDLASTETLFRIAAFIGLGLVLLAVSYVYQRLERGYFLPAPDELLLA